MSNKQIEELEKQLAKMKAEEEAKNKAERDAKIKAENDEKEKGLFALSFDELTPKKLNDLLQKWEEKDKDEKMAFFDVQAYMEDFNRKSTKKTEFKDTYMGKYGFSLDELANERYEVSFPNFNVKCVDQQGGGEGEGEHWHAVLKVTSKADQTQSRFFYIPGWYASYDGSTIEWSQMYEVEPYEKTVTDWRSVKKA